MTTFKKGDRVRSNVDAQGLRKGAEYTVTEVLVTSGFLGICRYYVTPRNVCGPDAEPLPSYPGLPVINGHLLLERVGGEG